MPDSSEKQDSPTPTSKTFDDLVAFKPDSASGYFYIPSALITQARLGDAYIIGEPGGDLKNVFTDMHDIACFLVLHGYDIHWIYQSLSEIRKVLASDPPEQKGQIFLFFAGHGETLNIENYSFLGKSSKNDSPITLSDVLEWKRFKSKPIFICLATCITHIDKRGPEKDFQAAHTALEKIIGDRKAIVWAPSGSEEERDEGNKRITQKLLGTLRKEVRKTSNLEVSCIPVAEALQPIVQKNNPEGSLLRSDHYTMIAYFTHFQRDQDDDDQRADWKKFKENITHQLRDTAVKRFWLRYAEYVERNFSEIRSDHLCKVLGGSNIERHARNVYDVLRWAENLKSEPTEQEIEIQPRLQGIRRDVEEFRKSDHKDWYQLRVLYLLVLLSTEGLSAQGKLSELEEAVYEIKDDSERKNIQINQKSYLPERFWDYLKDQLRTLAQEQPLKPETYKAIAYFYPNDKVWLDALAKLACEMEQRVKQKEEEKEAAVNDRWQVVDNGEAVKQALEEEKEAAVKQALKDATPILEQHIKKLDERISREIERLDGRITKLDERISGEIKRLDGRITRGFRITAGICLLAVFVVVIFTLFLVATRLGVT